MIESNIYIYTYSTV